MFFPPSQSHFLNELSTFTVSNISPPTFFNAMQISQDPSTPFFLHPPYHPFKPFLPGYQQSSWKTFTTFLVYLFFSVLDYSVASDSIFHSSVLNDFSIHETTFPCFTSFAASSFIILLLCPWNSPGKNTGMVSHSLLQGLFWTQGSNSDLPPL